MPRPPKQLRRFDSLVEVIAALRGPDGCPWDKEQTHQTMTRYAIEEAAELCDALDSGNPEAIKEELGDVLLQVVLNAEIARQSGAFNIEDVIEHLNRKMIRRHPHVFAEVAVKNSEDVVNNWQRLKEEEKKNEKTRPLSAGLPSALPALLASQKIGEKTKAHRFDWTRIEDVLAKVDEELSELKLALKNKAPHEETMGELGDLLFTVAQLARHLGGDSEQALRKTNRRFETRFFNMMESLKQTGVRPQEATPELMEKHWQSAKKRDTLE